jgi:hypothetical protein
VPVRFIHIRSSARRYHDAHLVWSNTRESALRLLSRPRHADGDGSGCVPPGLSTPPRSSAPVRMDVVVAHLRCVCVAASARTRSVFDCSWPPPMCFAAAACSATATRRTDRREIEETTKPGCAHNAVVVHRRHFTPPGNLC